MKVNCNHWRERKERIGGMYLFFLLPVEEACVTNLEKLLGVTSRCMK